MEKDVMVLKDGTELPLESISSIGGICAKFADRTAFVDTWGKLTPENLSELQIKTAAGIVAVRYTGMVLGNPQIRDVCVDEEGVTQATFCIREKTELELLKERVTAVEETTDVLTMEALEGGATA